MQDKPEQRITIADVLDYLDGRGLTVTDPDRIQGALDELGLDTASSMKQWYWGTVA